MPSWNHKLAIPFFHNEELSLHDKAIKIVAAVKARPWYEKLYYLDEMESYLEELADAGEANDVEWFDGVWNAMYDIFDAERVWVETM
jgi:hypothetical protein